MLIAWLLTLPAAGCTAGVVCAFMRIFGSGATGPVIVTAIVAAALGYVFLQRVANRATGAEVPA